MTLYSTSPLQHDLVGPLETLQIYFRVFVRIVPDLAFGRRWEMLRHIEKIQHLADLAIQGIPDITVEGPIMAIPQIGQAPARLTIAGWYGTTGANVLPVDRSTQPGEIHSGTVPGEKTSLHAEIDRGGSLALGQSPTAVTDSRVSTLRSLIETALSGISGIDKVTYIDFNGVEYGQILPRKGFRSFP